MSEIRKETRIHRGDIIVNLWAGEGNPTRKGIYIGNGHVLSAYKGIHKTNYNTRMLQQDEEHFVVVGHAPIDRLFAEMLDKYTHVN